jgi:histidyl-tRNA synthetase
MSIKGGDVVFDPNTLLKKAHDVARYYGFFYLPDYLHTHKEKRTRMEPPGTCVPRELDSPGDTFAKVTHALAELRALSPEQPLLVWGSSITPGRPSSKTAEIFFMVFGGESTLTDAFVMRAGSAFAEDVGGPHTLHLTSLGDLETRERHQRDFAHYLRKYIAMMHPDIQATVRRDPKKSFSALLEHADDLPASIPTTLEHLSESARTRFEELLERLDESETPYELSPYLFDPTGLFSHVRFSILGGKGFQGEGARFSDIVHKFDKHGKGAVGVSFSFKTSACDACKAPARPRGKTVAVFIQLGPIAKHLSFSLLEELRATRVPLVQTITIESLGEQMKVAERYDAPYYLILGHKEALEGTVILRDVKNQAQETIPRNRILDRMQKLV